MERVIPLCNIQEAQALFGTRDKNLRTIGEECNVKIFSRGDKLKLKGSSKNVRRAEALLEALIGSLRSGKAEQVTTMQTHVHSIAPKTKGQRLYVEAINKYDIVFVVGPAGTGKTYLAVWKAQEALKKGLIRRIILTRPAIEAGESLGFLPGDIYEKISPYLRPLYDALYDMMEPDVIDRYVDTGIIEVAPLAYMRGRTLNDAFIILDEAQNCTAEQMKMFLTRLGFDSKAVITADITQSDLPGGKPTGLLQAQELLSEIEGIKFIYLTGSDIVRHELVQKIIEAYEKASHKK
ncbi:MAG: PhoH family protein [Candidatus Omnitrophota bacterium]